MLFLYFITSPPSYGEETTTNTQDSVAFFPASTFTQGSGVAPDESPKFSRTIDAYYIDKTEVSIANFELFVQQAWTNDVFWSSEGQAWRSTNPSGANPENRSAGRSENHPVVSVTWYEAEAYCAWKGGRLPTEAEWERASCAGGGPYAWGADEMEDAVWYSSGKYGHVQAVLTKEVLDAPPEQRTPQGLFHTTGNVWEWTSDWYHADSYKNLQNNNTWQPTNPTWKTLRGGSFMNLPSYCSCTHREPARPDRVSYTVGFRCAYDTDPQK